MRILHTSDWHLGRSLVKFSRYDEFSAFLAWLIETLNSQKVDVLIVAGDIFDTTTPSNKAQELYYQFLGEASKSHCKSIIIVAGNHDSPTFLDAPKKILRTVNVHVIGTINESPEEQVVTLIDNNNNPCAIVCAVPYLRDKDIRNVTAGETVEEKAMKQVEGLKNHYKTVCDIAEQKQKELGDIPIIATGHLFTAGGKTIDGDGVKELYVGSLSHINIDLFPTCIDYLALGHLHIPQKVGKCEHIRYSGSPIPMGFGEAKQQKKVVLIEFNGRKPSIEEISIPCFQSLEKISGTMDEIKNRLHKLKQSQSNACIEIEYTGQEIVPNLQQEINEALTDTKVSVTRIVNQQIINRLINLTSNDETLDDLGALDVFNRCLAVYEVPKEQQTELIQSYKEILMSLNEDDVNKE